jgi:multiple sugar transport system permease protein
MRRQHVLGRWRPVRRPPVSTSLTITPHRGRRRGPGLQQQERTWGYLFILPSFIGFLAFTAFPIVASAFLSLVDWDILTPWSFIGLRNYGSMLKDPLFWTVYKNTAVYVAGVVPFQVFLSMFIAMLLNERVAMLTFYRVVYFLPVVCSLVAIAMLWQWIYQPEWGPLNYVLALFGIKGPNWLADPSWAMPAVIVTSIWKGLGFNIVIYLAGLQGIPESYYEAADLSGANWLQKTFRITIPLLSPTTFFVTVMGIISAFQVFGSVFIMTRGGPGDATRTLVYLIYSAAFQWFQMGYASALAWVLALTVFVFTIIQWRARRGWVSFE